MRQKLKEDGQRGLPEKQGLYDPHFEHDACGMGIVANIKGRKSNEIIRQALTVLKNLTHRGARGAEPNTGDGAGIMIQVPHAFLSRKAERHSFSLPEPGHYGVGIIFLPPDMKHRRAIEIHFEKVIASEGQRLIGWRTVKVNNEALGNTAKLAEPKMRMVFIARSADLAEDMDFERKLYVIRKRAENEIRHGGRFESGDYFYVPSLSCKTLVYKGMLVSDQLENYFLDLTEPDMESALAIVHSRFSTNTFPSWERAHPYRYVSHNGEINTLRGNVNWIRAQEAMIESDLFGADMKKILPIILSDGSDTAMFDNFLEFLVLAGRSLPHAMAMMIPEPWSNDESMDDGKRAFYEFHANLMEPWDGPAAMGFSDGNLVGAMLDRNGLRPARYYITTDDRLLLASEVGVLDVPAEMVASKGRLSPGRMLLVDTQQGRLIHDEEIKATLAGEHPYRDWLNKYQVRLEDLPEPRPGHIPANELPTLIQRQKAFGYTTEDLNMILLTMARDGVEPVGSMGNDAALAVLSTKPRLLYDYFRQLFAQVTNPPIDSIREALVISTEIMVGAESSLLKPTPQSCHQIRLDAPILTNEELAKIRHGKIAGFISITLPMLFQAGTDGQGLEAALEEICRSADAAIARGINLIILSDRGMDEMHAPIPALLAVSGIHHHLIRKGTRTQVGLLLESGEPREVHHFAALISYGATAINPYLAYESLEGLIQDGTLQGVDIHHAIKNYVKSAVKGVVKTLSKMGISAIQSYCGAQIFEALGIHQAVIDKYFTHTPSRIGGINMDVIATEAEMRHHDGFSAPTPNNNLQSGGQYKWRKDGERHTFNPQSIYYLQTACRTNDYGLYKKYASLISDDINEPATLRVLFDLQPSPNPIPIEEVEPVESIVRRFKTGAMSYGSISQEAHEAMAIAMNRIGGKSNSGEGGEDPARFPRLPNGDWKRSAIKQVASARLGVTSEYLVNAEELQIKMAQGAKPGEGGQLPGRKVYPWIARVRHSTPGVGLISPPPHHDIYSIEDLAELIHDLKNANREARITVKLVSEVGVGTIAAGVAKGHADVVLISGHDGGTGASPVSSIKHAGLPWELGLAEAHQTLMLNGLRDRIAIEVDGQLKTGRDVVIAALLGAEEFGFATAPLVALGCVMMRVCHLDTCPEGVATQNPELRKNFKGDPQHVINFMYFIAQDLREWMAKLGFRTVQEMIGRSDKIHPRKLVDHWKARNLDFTEILYRMDDENDAPVSCRVKQDHGLEHTLDSQILLDLCRPAIKSGKLVDATLPIRNINRVVGTSVGSEVTRKYGAAGLPNDTIRLHFQGSAGQSFGAFIPKGMTLILEGDSNDYIGKGLSGGRIVVYPPSGSGFAAAENIIIGNVAFYGATSGEAFVSGVAGERFCIRNSGANAVVEGIGDHGCEYMTGGRVVVLGKTGRNFGAGMSGGIAYVLDETGEFPNYCNQEMVSLQKIQSPQEANEVREMIQRHFDHTNSELAKRVLAHWDSLLPKFVRIIPYDYERALDTLREVEATGLTGDDAIMAAFERNKNDLARISGN